MKNDLLDKCYDHVKEHVQRVTLSNIELFGCSIVSDCWSNVQRKPLVNVMIVSLRGEMFVQAVDSHGQIKFGSYIADVIITIIEEVGAKNVVQILMGKFKELQKCQQNLKALITTRLSFRL